MILDSVLSYKVKVYISVICAGLWIYFRTQQCYVMIPRMQIFPVIYVMTWSYLNYYEPLFLPIGLFILWSYSEFYTRLNNNIKQQIKQTQKQND
jgi:hypothetical protein